MKKIFVQTLTILFIVCLCFLTASAKGENAQSAVSVEANEKFEILFDDETYEYYLKFTPAESNWYEINLDTFSPEETYITVYDHYGDEIGFTSWNEFSNTCCLALELKSNQIYYIAIDCFAEYNFTVSGEIRVHTHNFKLYDIYQASEYSDGYIENECIICEHIDTVNIPKVNISCSETKFIYNGQTQVPTITVTDIQGKNFVEGVDYTINYPKASVDALEDDSYYLTVEMENDYYYVYEEVDYQILPKPIDDLIISISKTEFIYGEKPTISIAGLKEGKDFECYMSYWSVGEQKGTVYGIGNYTGEKDITFTVYPAKIKGLKVSKTTASSIEFSWKYDENYSTQYYQIYDVKNKKIVATIDCYNTSYTVKKLKAGTTYNFKVRGYSKENGEKYYGEWKTITGVTKPASASLSSLKSTKAKTFIAKWDKVTSATGYQIQYSISSNFSNSKIVKMTKNTTTSKTVSSLKSGKKYYVRIRTYKTVKVDGKSKTVYSSWSKASTIKVK